MVFENTKELFDFFLERMFRILMIENKNNRKLAVDDFNVYLLDWIIKHPVYLVEFQQIREIYTFEDITNYMNWRISIITEKIGFAKNLNDKSIANFISDMIEFNMQFQKPASNNALKETKDLIETTFIANPSITIEMMMKIVDDELKTIEMSGDITGEKIITINPLHFQNKKEINSLLESYQNLNEHVNKFLGIIFWLIKQQQRKPMTMKKISGKSYRERVDLIRTAFGGKYKSIVKYCNNSWRNAITHNQYEINVEKQIVYLYDRNKELIGSPTVMEFNEETLNLGDQFSGINDGFFSTIALLNIEKS